MSKIKNYLKMIVTTMICFAMNMVPEKFLSVFSGVGQAVAAHKKRYGIAGKSYIMKCPLLNRNPFHYLKLTFITQISLSVPIRMAGPQTPAPDVTILVIESFCRSPRGFSHIVFIVRLPGNN